MDYEAKYKEALELAKMSYHTGDYDRDTLEMLEIIFPELCESEDEKIRKHLISLVKNWDKDEIAFKYTSDANDIKQILVWLEKQGNVNALIQEASRKSYTKGMRVERKHWLDKQGEPYGKKKECLDCQFNYTCECKGSCAMKRGEQKSTDKIEPKFKVGDWIVFNGLTLYVKEVVKGFYRTITIDGIPNSYDWEIDNVARLWTIQDAKDGDVFYTANRNTFIFKNIIKNGVYCYCGLYFGNFDGTKSCVNGQLATELPSDYVPATKEQRDLLFQKMREAGYEWNADTKELKKIEQSELTEFEEAVKDMMDDYRDAIDEHAATTEEVKKRAAYMLSLIPHKSAWSEEDNPYYDDICEILINLLHSERTDINKVAIQKDLDWLWHIKQRSLNDVAKEVTKNKETAMSFLKSCGIMNANGELADEYKIKQDEQKPAWSEEVENKPNGGIVMEDFNDGNGFYKINLAYLNEEQVEEIEELVKRWDLQPREDEDESIISDLLDYFDEDKCLKHEVNDIVKWLKSIKPQQKGWSENEIKMFDNLTTYLDGRKDLLEDIKSTYISWLKSLKCQITWKPSDEQIGALQAIVNDPNNASSESCQIVLKEIIKQLKKTKRIIE